MGYWSRQKNTCRANRLRLLESSALRCRTSLLYNSLRILLFALEDSGSNWIPHESRVTSDDKTAYSERATTSKSLSFRISDCRTGGTGTRSESLHSASMGKYRAGHTDTQPGALSSI